MRPAKLLSKRFFKISLWKFEKFEVIWRYLVNIIVVRVMTPWYF